MDLASFTAPVMIPFCEVVLEFTLIVAFKIQISLLYLYITSVKTVTSVVHGLHNWKGLLIAFLFVACISHILVLYNSPE